MREIPSLNNMLEHHHWVPGSNYLRTVPIRALRMFDHTPTSTVETLVVPYWGAGDCLARAVVPSNPRDAVYSLVVILSPTVSVLEMVEWYVRRHPVSRHESSFRLSRGP